MDQENSIPVDPFPQVRSDSVQSPLPFVRANSESLPFSSNSLDYITAFYAFHHFDDKYAALRECRRTLKDKGLLFIIEEFPRFSLQTALLTVNDEFMNRLIYSTVATSSIDDWIGNSLSYFDKNELYTAVYGLGFEIVKERELPTKSLYKLFKTRKIFFVLRKI